MADQRTRRMTRRLPNSRQVPTQHHHHNHAICATYAQRINTTLVEESEVRLHQHLEAVPQHVHREFQINLQAAIIARRTEGLQTRNPRVPENLYPTVDHTQKLG